MKKLFLVAGLLVASMSFAKPVETKQEEVTLVKVTEITNEKKVFDLSKEEQELLKFCITNSIFFYEGTFVGMDGQTYVYGTLWTSTTCYF